MTLVGDPHQRQQRHASWDSLTPLQKTLDIVFILLVICVFALPFMTNATGEESDTNQAGQGGCNNSQNKYDPNLPDTEKDQQGKQGLIGLSCSDKTNGITTSGTCAGVDDCKASNPKGAPPQQQSTPSQSSQVTPDEPPSSPPSTPQTTPSDNSGCESSGTCANPALNTNAQPSETSPSTPPSSTETSGTPTQMPVEPSPEIGTPLSPTEPPPGGTPSEPETIPNGLSSSNTFTPSPGGSDLNPEAAPPSTVLDKAIAATQNALSSVTNTISNAYQSAVNYFTSTPLTPITDAGPTYNDQGEWVPTQSGGAGPLPLAFNTNTDFGIQTTPPLDCSGCVYNETTGQYEGQPSLPGNGTIQEELPINPASPSYADELPPQLSPEYQPTQPYVPPNYAGLFGGYTAPNELTPPEDFSGPTSQQLPGTVDYGNNVAGLPGAYQPGQVTAGLAGNLGELGGNGVSSPQSPGTPFEASPLSPSPSPVQSALNAITGGISSAWTYLKSLF